VTVHFFGIILKYGIKYWKKLQFLKQRKYFGEVFKLLNTLSAINPEILAKSLYWLWRNCTLSSRTFFLSRLALRCQHGWTNDSLATDQRWHTNRSWCRVKRWPLRQKRISSAKTYARPWTVILAGSPSLPLPNSIILGVHFSSPILRVCTMHMVHDEAIVRR